MDQTSDFERIQVETGLSKSCFICLNDITKSAEHNHQDKKLPYQRRGESEVDKRKQCAGSVKILTSYILQNSHSSSSEQDQDELQRNILSSFRDKKSSICSECLSKAENLLKLHLELEKIQMQILDVLKSLQDYLWSSMDMGGHGLQEESEDDTLSSFREVVAQEFMNRELSDGTEVRLEQLINAGYDLSTLNSSPSDRDLDTGNDLQISDDNKQNNVDDLDPYEDDEYCPDVGVALGSDGEEENVNIPITNNGKKAVEGRRGRRKGAHRNQNRVEEGQRDFKYNPSDVNPNSVENTADQEDGDGTNVMNKKLSSSSERHPCQFCPETFSQSYHRDAHEKIHLNLREYKCTEPGCPYSANTPSNLKNHMKVHKEKMLNCKHCSKTFRARTTLRSHENTHALEKPFPCRGEGCVMRFNASANRMRHEERMHGIQPKRRINQKQNQEERRHLCDSCPKSYKDHRDLRRHRESAHGNPEMVKCPHCPKIFRKYCLYGHMKQVHEEKLWRCQDCGKTFAEEDGLKAHQETHHAFKKIKTEKE